MAHAVYWNNATLTGGIEKVDRGDIWTNENPNGWTYQDIGDIHDTCQGVYSTLKEAETILQALEEA